jgi:hypothetical protein
MSAHLDALAATEQAATKKKRRKPTPLLGRSLALLRREGYLVDVVERRVPFTFVTKDLFGIFDAVAISKEHVGVLGVQVTSAANRADRRQKLTASPALGVWCAAGNRAELHAWWLSRTGGRKAWTLTRELL